jgi:hypothetical protein
MQIALNSGQYHASTGKKLNYVNLDTYILKKQIHKINTVLKNSNLLDVVDKMK